MPMLRGALNARTLAAVALLAQASPAFAAGVNPPVGGGGSCGTSVLELDGTVGQQQAYDDGLYTCANQTSWVAESFIVGSTLAGGTAASCTTTNAGMIEYSSSTFQGCTGSGWISLVGGSVSGTVNSGTQYQMAYYATSAAAISGDSKITTDANNVLNITSTTVTTSDPALNVTQTWNAGGATFTGIVETITSTASAAASLLINLLVAATSEFSVDKSGDVTAAGYVNSTSIGTGFELNGANAISFPTGDTLAGASIAIGPGALSTETAAGSSLFANTAVGYYAMGGGTMTTGSQGNVAIGYQAAYTMNGAGSFVDIGYEAGYTSPAGPSVAIGYKAAFTYQGGSDVAIGYEALYSGSGGDETAIGYQAGQYVTGGGSDVAVGYNALATTTSTVPLTGGNHTAIGALALQNAQGTAASNTALGYEAGGSITTGSSNTVIGYEVASTTLQTGSNNILIGTTSGVDTLSATTSNFVSIGNLYEGDVNVGHIVFHGSTSAIGSGSADCGTSPAIAGNDNIGIVTVGSSTNGGVCTVTFTNGGWTTAPVCFAQDQTTGNLMRPVSTTTTLKITGTLTAGDVISYRCAGYQL